MCIAPIVFYLDDSLEYSPCIGSLALQPLGQVKTRRRVPVQSLLRLIKRWRQYQPRGNWAGVPKQTRGIYVLYKETRERKQAVVYIGVAGIGRNGGGGIKGRLKSHNRKKKGWTHYSVFEVHDNVSPDELQSGRSISSIRIS
jgi:hypothetical protein